jgi:hypothetical protein
MRLGIAKLEVVRFFGSSAFFGSGKLRLAVPEKKLMVNKKFLGVDQRPQNAGQPWVKSSFCLIKVMFLSNRADAIAGNN